MTVVHAASAAPMRAQNIAYGIATAFVAINAVVAGVMDVLRMEPLYGALIALGYPPYFGAILGTWKVLGAIALVVPGWPRLKEWAYAGMFFDFTAAIASYLAMGVLGAELVGPIASLVALAASWSLRPASRRLA